MTQSPQGPSDSELAALKHVFEGVAPAKNITARDDWEQATDPRQPSGRARAWARTVAEMDPATIAHRTRGEDPNAGLEERRSSLLRQVNGASQAYTRLLAESRNAQDSGAVTGSERPVTGSRVEKPADGSLRKE
ncbi:hypothetical protein [Kribbella shirazensis]|uniref:Uncharacterized protein n=1 Tax=Kribbella shirazensis TaxID=1105143 RepID=A0A7X5VBN5_9ACTN|nr:hypothetical protein [Kribbella shirazensis]NIK57592.1 hypothetical protein [Kribbella shirazensis]